MSIPTRSGFNRPGLAFQNMGSERWKGSSPCTGIQETTYARVGRVSLAEVRY